MSYCESLVEKFKRYIDPGGKELFIDIMKFNLLLLLALLFTQFIHCKPEKSTSGCPEFVPPAEARSLTFTRNSHIKDRHVYQSNSDVLELNAAQPRLKLWFATQNRPDHRLWIQLLGDSPELVFRLLPAASSSDEDQLCQKKGGNGQSEYSCTLQRGNLTACSYIIEVFSQKELKGAASEKFRIFTGISGKKPLAFKTGSGN